MYTNKNILLLTELYSPLLVKINLHVNIIVFTVAHMTLNPLFKE